MVTRDSHGHEIGGRESKVAFDSGRWLPPDPATVPQWGTDDWREWARRTRAAISRPPDSPPAKTANETVAKDSVEITLQEALAALRAKRDTTTNPAYQRTLDATIRELEAKALDALPAIRDALRWYADDERYRSHYPAALQDAGQRARDALATSHPTPEERDV